MKICAIGSNVFMKCFLVSLRGRAWDHSLRFMACEKSIQLIDDALAGKLVQSADHG
jgi:hypothetical protein